MDRRWTILPMMGALLLCGCGVNQQQTADQLALQLRTDYLSMSAFSTAAEITADYGEAVYVYQLQVEGTQLGGTLTVTAPEEVAGVSVTWQQGETTLTYQGVSVETGSLSPDGLSPTDGIPLILSALRGGAITSTDWENWEEEQVLVITMDNPNVLESGAAEITVWADPADFDLLRGEIAWEGTTVLQVTFSEFTHA